MPSDNFRTPDDDALSPSQESMKAFNQRSEPGPIGKKFAVPEDLKNAGHDTNEPHADSPESLDQDDA